MHLPKHQRILLLTEGRLGVFSSKTAASLLRYRSAEIVGVIDSVTAGQDVREFIPWAPNVPVLASVAEGAALRPDALYIGIAPSGGALPDELRTAVRLALEAGIDVVSGLHQQLALDDALSACAKANGARIVDVRRAPDDCVIATALARDTRCRRVLTVGTDANVGKMVTALALTEAARARKLNAHFVATGQTGIMIVGSGVAIDAVVSDFAAGAVESLVLEHADADLCFIEGQGSIAHPGFSSVTLAAIHGACPDAMILVHRVGRTHSLQPPGDALLSIPRMIALYEQCASAVHGAKVVGIALNGQGVSKEEVQDAARTLRDELGIPVVDPIADGCEALLDAAVDVVGDCH